MSGRLPHRCKECHATHGVSTMQIRAYKKRWQWLWNFRLCNNCRDSLFEMLAQAATSGSDGLFNPPPD